MHNKEPEITDQTPKKAFSCFENEDSSHSSLPTSLHSAHTSLSLCRSQLARIPRILWSHPSSTIWSFDTIMHPSNYPTQLHQQHKHHELSLFHSLLSTLGLLLSMDIYCPQFQCWMQQRHFLSHIWVMAWWRRAASHHHTQADHRQIKKLVDSQEGHH